MMPSLIIALTVLPLGGNWVKLTLSSWLVF